MVDIDFVKWFAAAFWFVAALFVIPLMSSTAGAFIGWVVGLVWGDAILSTLRSVGLSDKIALWQVGCTFGFFAGFFTIKTSGNS